MNASSGNVKSLCVPLSDRSYHLHIDHFEPQQMANLLVQAFGKVSGVAILIDEQVMHISPRAKPLIDAISAELPHVQHFLLPVGESAKNLTSVEQTAEWLVANGYDRHSVIVGIGGGASTDHAGFVAAIYLRGIRFALCPTTLLAMVDASVGGKTAVDLKSGKNLIGAFHQPVTVLADLGFLDTLPRREIAAGMAEVIKSALIGDAEFFEFLENTDDLFEDLNLLKSIVSAVQVKIGVVSEDEKETGRRAILNFGHTFGHAVESESNYALLHGEAVSLGMVAALAIGERRGITKLGLRARCERLLLRAGLPIDVQKYLTDSTFNRLKADKKRSSNSVRFVHVPFPGQAKLEDINFDVLRDDLMVALSAKSIHM